MLLAQIRSKVEALSQLHQETVVVAAAEPITVISDAPLEAADVQAVLDAGTLVDEELG